MMPPSNRSKHCALVQTTVAPIFLSGVSTTQLLVAGQDYVVDINCGAAGSRGWRQLFFRTDDNYFSPRLGGRVAPVLRGT